MIDLSKIEDIDFDGIDTRDYPEFCDAFICSATMNGKELTDSELSELNEQSDFVYEKLMEYLY